MYRTLVSRSAVPGQFLMMMPITALPLMWAASVIPYQGRLCLLYWLSPCVLMFSVVVGLCYDYPVIQSWVDSLRKFLDAGGRRALLCGHITIHGVFCLHPRRYGQSSSP